MHAHEHFSIAPPNKSAAIRELLIPLLCVFFPAQDVRAFPSAASTSTSSEESRRLEVGLEQVIRSSIPLNFLLRPTSFSIIYHIAAAGAETLLLSHLADADDDEMK